MIIGCRAGVDAQEEMALVWASSRTISTPMFIAVLFTIAKIWKQPKCPSTDERIKQLWDICTMNSTQP